MTTSVAFSDCIKVVEASVVETKALSNELRVFLSSVLATLNTSNLDFQFKVRNLQVEFLPLDEQSLLQRIDTVKSRIIDILWKVDPSTLEKLQKIPPPQFSQMYGRLRRGVRIVRIFTR